MKLLGLKDTPELFKEDVEDCLSYLSDSTLDIDKNTFHTDVLNALNKDIQRTMFDPDLTANFTKYSVRVSTRDAKAKVKIYTKKSVLTEVLTFLKQTLHTSSSLSEVHGRKDRHGLEYTYTIELDMSNGEYVRDGNKMFSGGIYRLIILCYFLRKWKKDSTDAK